MSDTKEAIVVTKEQFLAYLEVRDSGMTNMFDVNQVIALSDVELTKPICIAIMEQFGTLSDKYK